MAPGAGSQIPNQSVKAAAGLPVNGARSQGLMSAIEGMVSGGGMPYGLGAAPTYSGSADQAPWTAVQQLDPAQQYLYNQDLRIRGGQGNIAEGMLRNVGETYSQPANFAEQLPDYQRVNYGGPFYRSNVNSRDDAEQAIYNRQMRFMYPDYQQREKDLQNQLLSQGLNIGDDAYQRGIGEFQAQRDRAMADVRDQAILGGGTEATQELQRGLMTAQPWFQNQQSEQNRALQWALQNIGTQQQDRSRLLNEMNAFRTGQQIQTPGLPAQFSTPNLQGIDQLGLANQTYQNQLGSWNANQASNSGLMSGLFGLAGTALGGPLGGMLGGWLGNQFGGR